MNRRSLLGSIIFASAALNLPVKWVTSARAEQKDWRHGLSLFGELKYPADFKHFDYVHPNAPKGGASSAYGLLAEAVSRAADFSSVSS
jgi:microcin C transport system substrate-binding protein